MPPLALPLVLLLLPPQPRLALFNQLDPLLQPGQVEEPRNLGRGANGRRLREKQSSVQGRFESFRLARRLDDDEELLVGF